MEYTDFLNTSANFLSTKISASVFDVNDRDVFGFIEEPFKLGSVAYKIYIFKRLTGYLPASGLKDFPIMYTFYLAVPQAEVKEIFITESEKKNHGIAYNKDVIASYYSNFVPAFKPFSDLTNALKEILNTDLYPNKGYDFGFHLTTTTAQSDFAMVFLELGSVNRFLDVVKKDPTLSFNPA